MINEKMEMNVFLVNVRKITKKANGDKVTILKCAFPSEETNFRKGLDELEQWVDGHGLFEKLKNEHFGIPLVCHYVYDKTYNGQAKMKIVDIIKDGEYIFG